MVADVISWAMLAAGSFFLLAGGIGLLRMPDFFTRLHAAGVTDTAGAGLMLFGLMLQAGFTLVTVKLLLALFLILFTSPTACHALAKAALQSGLQPGHDDGTGIAAGATPQRDSAAAPAPRSGTS